MSKSAHLTISSRVGQVAGSEGPSVALPLHNTRNRSTRRSSIRTIEQSGRGTQTRKRCRVGDGPRPSDDVSGTLVRSARGREKLPKCGKRMQCGTHGCEQGLPHDEMLTCGECAASTPKTPEPLCAACRRGVNVSDNEKPRWAHLCAEDRVRASILVGEGVVPLGPDVVAGFMPHVRMCFCTRKSCFYAAYMAEKRAVERRTRDVCEACKKTIKGAARNAGDHWVAMQTFYGVSVQPKSIVCQPCRMRFVMHGRRAKGASVVAVDSISSFKVQLQGRLPFLPDSIERARVMATIAILGELEQGAVVSMDVGICFLKKAREELSVPAVQATRLKQISGQIFKAVDGTARNARYVDYSSAEVGGKDDRKRFQYLVPRDISARHAVERDVAALLEQSSG